LAAPRDDVDAPRAYLVTIVSRLCLDQLGSARHRRETYVASGCPEPVATGPEPIRRTVDGVLILLERLSPAERAFLLAET
jgi:RNA polymerase sigma-70 factor (ECF subfamily)